MKSNTCDSHVASSLALQTENLLTCRPNPLHLNSFWRPSSTNKQIQTHLYSSIPALDSWSVGRAQPFWALTLTNHPITQSHRKFPPATQRPQLDLGLSDSVAKDPHLAEGVKDHLSDLIVKGPGGLTVKKPAEWPYSIFLFATSVLLKSQVCHGGRSNPRDDDQRQLEPRPKFGRTEMG